MSPSRSRWNCVAQSSSAWCGSSSSVRSGKVASQREIKSGLGIGDTPVRTHRAPKIAARKAQKKGARAAGDMVWEQAPKKLSKCRYTLATIAAEKPDNQRLGCLTEPRQSPLLPLSAGRMAASPQVLRVRRRGKSGLQGSTVPDNLRRG